MRPFYDRMPNEIKNKNIKIIIDIKILNKFGFVTEQEPLTKVYLNKYLPLAQI